MCMERRRLSQTMASEWQTAFVVSQNTTVCLAHSRQELRQKSWKTARLFLQDRDQDQMFKTKTKTSWSNTKTKIKTFIFVLEAPRDQDPGLEDYITGFKSTSAGDYETPTRAQSSACAGHGGCLSGRPGVVWTADWAGCSRTTAGDKSETQHSAAAKAHALALCGSPRRSQVRDRDLCQALVTAFDFKTEALLDHNVLIWRIGYSHLDGQNLIMCNCNVMWITVVQNINYCWR